MTGRFDAAEAAGDRACSIGGVTLLWLSRLNLQAGYWDIFWPQLIQGVGMSLLFVPLTTVAMDPIPRERMGNATSLFNLMRNIGGSIGIAMTGTMLARHQQATTAMLGAHVTPYDPATQSMFAQMRGGVHGRRRRRRRPRPAAPTRRCSAWCSGRRRWCRSSASSSCSALLFLALVPLVLLMKRPTGAAVRPRRRTEDFGMSNSEFALSRHCGCSMARCSSTVCDRSCLAQPDPLDRRVRGGDRQRDQRADHAGQLGADRKRQNHRDIRQLQPVAVRPRRDE